MQDFRPCLFSNGMLKQLNHYTAKVFQIFGWFNILINVRQRKIKGNVQTGTEFAIWISNLHQIPKFVSAQRLQCFQLYEYTILMTHEFHCF